MTAQDLRSAAEQMLDALRSGDRKRLAVLAERHGREIATAALNWVEQHVDDSGERLDDEEQRILLLAYDNAMEATPKLTEMVDESWIDTARRLSERGLVTFTSIPSFILITRRGIRFVEERGLNT